MKRSSLIILTIVLCLWSSTKWTLAEDAHAHHDHGHDVSGPELGISAGYVHLEKEEEDALGVHAHLLHRLGDDGIRGHLAIGVGAEYLFAEEEHYALMLSLAASPW